MYICINISASRECCPVIRAAINRYRVPAFCGIFFLAQSLFCAQHEALIRTELWADRIIHFKSARKNWQRKRNKRKKSSAGWRNGKILPGKRTILPFRKINLGLSGLFPTRSTLCHGEFLRGFCYKDTIIIKGRCHYFHILFLYFCSLNTILNDVPLVLSSSIVP